MPSRHRPRAGPSRDELDPHGHFFPPPLLVFLSARPMLSGGTRLCNSGLREHTGPGNILHPYCASVAVLKQEEEEVTPTTSQVSKIAERKMKVIA